MILLDGRVIIWLFCIIRLVAAVPTWPSSMDELEDIMFLHTGHRARAFAAPVTPCSAGAGPGRFAAAEFIRTAFHDMAAGNIFTGVDGLDGSIVFELGRADNPGPGFRTTLETFAPYLTTRSSISDLVALGVYTAVRSCGGPIIPIKTGRKDAAAAGGSGVPLPQNSIGTFVNQFARMGFSSTEMIALVACGHTTGGVKSAHFPEIVPAGTAQDGFQQFDTTAAFDEKIASEYVSGTTKDPLVVGPSVSNGRNSDARVFASDGNVTIAALADPETFKSVCATVLQKMIDVVPANVILTESIAPYEAKPVAVQLSLLDGGETLLFVGEIRIRTTNRAASEIASVQLVYKDRDGASTCGDCTITTTISGTATGFDDSFSFYEFSTELSVTSSISSFIVEIILTSGTTEIYDNNGVGFPVQDVIMFQPSQSCLNGGNLTVFAAVRAADETPSATLSLTLPSPRRGIPVPALQATAVAMTHQLNVGSYQLFAASYSLGTDQTQTTRFDVSIDGSSDTFTDSFKSTIDLPTTCVPFGTVPTSTPSSANFTYEGCFTDSAESRTFTGAVLYENTLTVEKCASHCISFQFFGLEYGSECYCGNQRSSISTEVLDSECNMVCSGDSEQICGAGNRLSVYNNTQYVDQIVPSVSGYSYLGCYEDPLDPRLLGDSSTAGPSMTVENCAAFCGDTTYFGVEYGAECYCDDTLPSTATKKPETDCSFPCAGNSSQICGAGFRINVYKSNRPSLPGYNYEGCHTDSVFARILTEKTTWSNEMTYSACADFCLGYVYFGVQYGTECYCGNSLENPTELVAETECSMPCAGEPSESCGNANRLTLFKSTASVVVSPPVSAVAIPGYKYVGCHTDSVESRALSDSVLFDGSMTVQKCADFCNGTKYFGVEYGGECYCGNQFANPTSLALENDCNYRCSGNNTEICGGPNRLSLYEIVV